MSLGNCRYCGRKWIYVKRCNDCGDICCDQCATGGTACRSCNSWNRVAFEKNSERSISSNDSSDYSESGTASNYHPITDTTGQGFLLFSCIAAIWLLPAMIALWVFITVWYLFYKIFGIKRRPFDESYWVGAGAICLALIGGAIVGGICSLFLGPFGVLIGLAIFIGILNTYD